MLVVGVLNIGVRWLTFGNRALDYLAEAAYPLYVLHMPVLILVGLSVVRSGLPNVIALPLIALATLILTLGLYEFVIKRIGVLRLVFGLKLLPHPAGGRNADSMREVGYRPDDYDDGGIAQPVGKR